MLPEEFGAEEVNQQRMGLFNETWSTFSTDESPRTDLRPAHSAAAASPTAQRDPLALLDVVVLTKALFEKARRESSLEIIPAIQRELIVNALGATAGNYAQAAKLLGITRSTLRKRVEKFEIKQQFMVR
jgi:transcriptional regulator of acetoin/glycerol metabolism